MKKWTILLLHLPFLLSAQDWAWVQPLDGLGNESCRSIKAAPDGGLFVGGAFEGSLEIEDWQALSEGESDLFLAAFGPDQKLLWALSAGGSQDDEIASIAILPSGDIVCVGAFWFELPLVDTVLSSGSSPRALFAARFSPEGELRWARSVSGQGLKGIAGIAAQSDDTLAISGFFEKTLELGDSTLESGLDDGSTFSFTALLDGAGNTLWAQPAGYSGDTRASALALQSDGAIVIGGFFNDTTLIGDAQFTANTFDRDVFLACYSPAGEVRWARKAGGVIDDELSAMAIDEQGNIYATGILVGVMTLSEEISIQSSTGNSDFYLLKYAPDGTPIFGRALGGQEVQQGLAIAVHGGIVAIGGAYQGAMAFDGFQADAGASPDGFIAGFNLEGQARWLATIPADIVSLTSTIDYGPEGQLFAGGAFGQQATFDEATWTSIGNTGLFIGQLRPSLTPVNAAPPTLSVSVYPNPAKEQLNLYPPGRHYKVALYDPLGRPVFQAQGQDVLALPNLPPGVYTLVVEEMEKVGKVQLVIY